jgi:predicted ATP-grasp superfamily ATP-dependent carboligase
VEQAIRLGKDLFKQHKLKEESNNILGLVEMVDFFGINKKRIKVLSKIDTGAYYGSIDFRVAQNLGFADLVEKAEQLKILHNDFQKETLIKEIKNDKRVVEVMKMKSSLGEQYRLIFNLKFKLGGVNLESKFTLADRSHMTYGVILGKFNVKKFVIDPLKYSNKFAPFWVNNLNDARPYFAISSPQVVGVGVNVFNRLGLGKVNDYYCVGALQNNDEDALLGGQIKQIFSLEKQGVNLNELKLNSQSLLKHQSFVDFLQNFKRRIFLLIYEPSESLERLAKKLNVNLIGNSSRLYKKLADKNNFRKIAKKLDLEIIESQLLKLPFDFEKVAHNLGEKLFVQLKNAGGGKGNFIINNQTEVDELAQKYPREEVIVSRFVDGYSPSITGCVTKYGVFYLPPQLQILDQDILVAAERGTGQFCGHDFSTDLINEEIKKQAYSSVEKIGSYLKKIGYKGIFGLDFLWDEKKKKLYVVECNPRLLGVHPTQTLIQIANNEIPLILWHTLEFLGATYKVDYEKIQKQYLNHKFNGSHLIISNLKKEKVVFKPNLKAGTYSFSGQEIKFERAEHDFASLLKNEFILTDGIPQNERQVRVWMRLCRIITREKVLASDFKTLNPWAQNLVRELRKKFGFVIVE